MPLGRLDEQAIALRDAMRVLFPEAVALVSAARAGVHPRRAADLAARRRGLLREPFSEADQPVADAADAR